MVCGSAPFGVRFHKLERSTNDLGLPYDLFRVEDYLLKKLLYTCIGGNTLNIYWTISSYDVGYFADSEMNNTIASFQPNDRRMLRLMVLCTT